MLYCPLLSFVFLCVATNVFAATCLLSKPALYNYIRVYSSTPNTEPLEPNYNMTKKYRKITDDVDESKALDEPGTSSSAKDRLIEENNKEASSTDTASDQTREHRQRITSDSLQTRTQDTLTETGAALPHASAISTNGGILAARTSTRSQVVLGKRSHSALEESPLADNVDVDDEDSPPMDFSALCEADQGDDQDTQGAIGSGGISRPPRNPSTFISPTYGVSWEEVMERECAGLTGQGLKRAEWRVRQRRARESKILRQQVSQRPVGRIQSAPVASRGGNASRGSDLQRLPAASGGFTTSLEEHPTALESTQPLHESWTHSSSLPQPSYSLAVPVPPTQTMMSGQRPGVLDSSQPAQQPRIPTPQSYQQPAQQQHQTLIPPPSSTYHGDFASPRGLGSLLAQLSELTSIISAQVQLQRRQQDLTINSIEMLSDLLRTYVTNERNSSAAQGIQQLSSSTLTSYPPQNLQNNH